jgi:hypothetical protein
VEELLSQPSAENSNSNKVQDFDIDSVEFIEAKSV